MTDIISEMDKNNVNFLTGYRDISINFFIYVIFEQ